MDAAERRDDGRTDELVVYGALDCCLCEEAMAVLRELAPGLGLSLRYVGIDGQPELERLYREQVPVGFLGGRKMFKFHVDPERLRRAAAPRDPQETGGETMAEESSWDQRYAGSDYFYGTEPNTFLAEHAGLLSGPVLSLSEGEGRNAVFLASRGLEVLGVDLSAVALEKARKLARARGVEIATLVADLAVFEPEERRFGSVVSISAHLPSALRRRLYPLVERSLRPGGILLLEAYSEDQLARDTGGPRDADMLMTVDKLRREFPNLEPVLLRETEREVREGRGHTGMASVVQFIARRPEEAGIGTPDLERPEA